MFYITLNLSQFLTRLQHAMIKATMWKRCVYFDTTWFFECYSVAKDYIRESLSRLRVVALRSGIGPVPMESSLKI